MERKITITIEERDGYQARQTMAVTIPVPSEEMGAGEFETLRETVRELEDGIRARAEINKAANV